MNNLMIILAIATKYFWLKIIVTKSYEGIIIYVYYILYIPSVYLFESYYYECRMYTLKKYFNWTSLSETKLSD